MKSGSVAAVWMECTACNGNDDNCPECDGRGKQKLATCPKSIPDAATYRVMQLAEFAEHGAFPVAGGVLDQSQSFLDACRVCWREDSYWKRLKTI